VCKTARIAADTRWLFAKYFSIEILMWWCLKGVVHPTETSD